MQALAWAVPDLSPLACRYHDWHYHLVELVRSWRAGSQAAADELGAYFAWLRSSGWVRPDEIAALILVRLDITRANGDAWLRGNYVLERDGGRWTRRLRVRLGSWLFWLGVRLGGVASA